jgi:DNA-binding transcriptional regulator YdaS (Cro superfamily)
MLLGNGDNMTAHQYRAALAKLGLSQIAAARLLGSADRTSRRWALGERSVPPAVAILLKLMIAGKITPDDLRRCA